MHCPTVFETVHTLAGCLLLIKVEENNRLEYELFQKPSDSGVSLDIGSCVPRHVKDSVAKQ